MSVSMISLTRMVSDLDGEQDVALASPVVAQPKCYALTIFTQHYREVRDFYVDILNAHVVTEKPDRACELELAGMPLCLRATEHGELYQASINIGITYWT